MRKLIVLLASMALLASSFAASAGQRCRYSAPRNTEIDAAGLKSLSVQIGADNLVIHGQTGLARIVVHGTACASEKQWLRQVKVETVRQGDTASVTTHDGGWGFWLFRDGGYAYLKLDVRVPLSLAVKLDVGAGNAKASDLASLKATLGAGVLMAKNIVGALGLHVVSGDAEADSVGSLNVSGIDSGGASVNGVHGDARIGGVDSGDLNLRNVKGSVVLGLVNSGTAKLADTGGRVKVHSVDSGELIVHDVSGDVAVDRVSSGIVRIEHAEGNVSAGSVGSGDFDAYGVNGDFSVGAVGTGDIHYGRIKGKVSISGQQH